MNSLRLLVLLATLPITPVLAKETLNRESFALPELGDNQELLIRTYKFGPGEKSLPHVHHALTYIYVIEGSLLMQAENEEAVVVGEGEIFFEEPGKVYIRSDNFSESEPVSYIAYMIKPIGTPSSVLVSVD